jgi:hypothetical protein
LEELELTQVFSLTQSVLLFEEPSQITEVLRMAGHMNEHDATSIARAITKPIGIMHLLVVAEKLPSPLASCISSWWRKWLARARMELLCLWNASTRLAI